MTDVMLLDAGEELYLWIGPGATANEKALTEENAKLRCRITHLLRALDDMEQKYEGGSK